MKIVCIAYLHGMGGAEKQSVLLANALAERNHEVTLISLCGNEKCYAISEKVRYIFIPDRRKGFLSIVSRFFDLRKTLKKIRPDITINFWFQPTYMNVLMPDSITGKVLYSERNDPGDREYSKLLRIVRTLTLPFVDGFVFQTKGAAGYFNKKIRRRSVIIPNPVNVGTELKQPEKREKVIITAGRLHPQKNQKLLINAFSLISDRFPGYRLVIYGDGELKDELLALAGELKIEDRVVIHEAIPNILEKVNEASLFVLSSDYEGLPNALLEAMALGVPCISTDCKPGGARELIINGENGLIVPRNDANRLAKAMKYMLEHESDALMMGKKAGKISSSHSFKKIYDKWEKFLKKLVGETDG